MIEQRAKGLGAGQPVEVEIDSGSAYELVLGLRMLVDSDEDPASYAVGPAWFTRSRELAGPELLETIERYSGGHEITFGYLLALVAESPAPRTVESFLATVEATTPRELRRLLLGGRLRTYRGGVTDDVIDAAADGDPAGTAALLERCLDWQRPAYEHVLSLDAEEAKRLLLVSSRGWHERVFEPDERTTMRAHSRSVRAARGLARRLGVAELVDTLTRGIRYTPEPGIERLLLVPNVVSRPWSIFTESGATKIACYGVADSHVTGDEPPDPLVAAFKALADENRLRILRRLAESPVTLQELTELLGLAKSTVHGHLLVLRTGGLVVTDTSDKRRYALRRERLAESAAELETYLELASE